MTFSFRKIGGLYWLAIGPYRLSFCRVRAHDRIRLPKAKTLDEILASVDFEMQAEAKTVHYSHHRDFTTYCDQEYNRFIF